MLNANGISPEPLGKIVQQRQYVNREESQKINESLNFLDNVTKQTIIH